ncbi:MBG domain-containing protein [Chitinophaga caseinilytica]|uniref:MBG domain-containing protein n=1 Tax=Chitinophaga caseinilytica TaxID=2267521 RepID=UPI003C30B8F4
MKHLLLRILPLVLLLFGSLTETHAAAPTLPSTNVVWNGIEGNYLNFYWTRGDGARRIVIARAGQPVSARPQDGKTYTADAAFGQGEAIKPGEYVIGDGNINQISLTGLTSGVEYYIAVFEYNGTGTTTEYLNSGFLTGSKATMAPPTQQASTLTFTNLTGSKATFNWTNGNGYGRIIVVREGSAVDATPDEFKFYNPNYTFGNGHQIGTGNYVVYNWYGSQQTQTIYGFKNNTTYHVAIYEYNGFNAPAYTRPAATGSFKTPSEPTQPPTNLYSDSHDTKQFRLLFPAGNGSKRLIIGRKGAAVTTVPQDGVTYTANAVFGQGSKLGTDEFVVYAGTDWLGTVTGLEPGTMYHFRAFEYEDASTPDYLTSAFSEGSTKTLTTPTTGPTAISADDIRAFQLTLKWTKGDGANRLLIAKANSPVDITPDEFQAYTANPSFGYGQQIGNGNYVMSWGAYTQTTVYQLQAGVTYHFALYEANGTVNPMYLKPAATFSATTQAKPTTHPSGLQIDSRAISSLRVYCNMGNGTKLLVIGKKGSPVTAVPVDKKVYRPSWKWADGEEIAPGEFVIHADTWNAPTVNTLEPNTTYHFRVINYNEINGEPFYYTADPMTDGSGTTIDYARPQASNLTFTDIAHTTMKLNFTVGGGARRLVVYKIGAPVDANPQDGTGYGTGSSLGNGNFVLGYTSNGEFTATGLTAGTNYHFAVYEMLPNLYYYTTPPLRGSATTTGTTQTITFPDLPTLTYGDADFDPQATASSNLPVSYEFSTAGYAEVVNGKVHILKAGTITITAKQDGDATYAPATPVSKTLRIGSAPLTIRADNQSIDFNAAIPALTATYTGFVLGETSAVLQTQPKLGTTAKTGDAPGDYTISISGAQAANYAITHIPGILTIKPPPRKPQTITFPALAALRYGMVPVALRATASSQLQVFYQSDNTGVAQIVNGELQIKGTGTARITANCPGDQTWEDAPPVSITVTVNKADLAILAENKTMTQGQAVPAFTAKYIGLVYGEQPTVLTTPAVLASTAGNTPVPGTYDITVTGATSPNYAITMTKGTLLVQPRPKQSQTITFTPIADKTYGDANILLDGTSSSQLPVTYRTTTPAVISITNGQVTILGSGNAVIIASQAGDNDFDPALDVSRTFVVRRATLEVKADDKSKVEGATNPALTVTYTGFVKNETVNVLTQRATPTTAVTTSTPAGSYPIFPGSAAAANYTMQYVNGTLTVTAKPKQTQNITFPLITAKTYGDADFAAGATASSQLAVRLVSLTPAVASIVNGQVHILKAGTATIRAEQDGNNDYLPATAVTRSVVVAKATITASPQNASKVYLDPMPAIDIRYTGFVKGENAGVILTAPIVNTPANQQSPAGVYRIRLTGGTAENYQFSYTEANLTITRRAQQLQFTAPANKVYGNANFALTATATSNLPVRFVSETPDIVAITGATVRILKAGTARIRAEQPGDNNWEAATPAIHSFAIAKAPLTVTAEDKTKVQGTDNPPLTVRYTGFVNGDNASDLQTAPIVSTTADRNSTPGNYPITATGAASGNYTLTYVPGTLTVTPRSRTQTITFPNPAPKTYGDGDFAAGASASSNLAVTYTSGNPNVATIINGQLHIVGAGTAVITARQAGNNEWLPATPVTRTLTVAKAPLTIRAADKTREVGAANPALNATYIGFVLNEGPSALTAPVILRTAATEYSRAGSYPITITTGIDRNYNITTVAGVLRVTEKPKDIVKAWASSRNTLQVNVTVMERQKASIMLFSTSGQRVYHEYISLDNRNNTFQLNVSNIPTGMYILQVLGDKIKLTQNVAIN